MVLPLYLAMTAAEMFSRCSLPSRFAYMACHFSPYTQGITNIPDQLPPGAMLILNDRMCCKGHSADLVVSQLLEVITRQNCESVLLDFQRPPEIESLTMVNTIIQSLPCPVAVTEGYGTGHSCPVFLSPAPMHMPLSEYLEPWTGREIWLEAALCQEVITVTDGGTEYTPVFPTGELTGGFYEETLRCMYHTEVTPEQIRFTLFETPETLEQKLEHAHSLGVSRAIGLWQELGTFPPGNQSAECSIEWLAKP